MKIYNKEITEEQAKYLLKCRDTSFMRGPRLVYYPGYDIIKDFEKIFDDAQLDFNSEELNSHDVECAVLDIIRKRNSKACFYAAYLLQDSSFPTEIFENVINKNKDIFAQFAYLVTLPSASAQEMVDNIAEVGITYYNLALIANSKNECDFTNNINVIMEKGSPTQLVYMAKNCKNVDVDVVRELILDSCDEKANYLFAYNINNSFNKNRKGTENYPALEKNNIYEFYKNLKESTRQKLIAQHIKKVIYGQDAQYNFKLAVNGILEDNPYIDKDKAYRYIKYNIISSNSVKYLTKYALEVENSDKDEALNEVKRIGTNEEIEYLEHSIAFSDFFRQTQ